MLVLLGLTAAVLGTLKTLLVYARKSWRYTLIASPEGLGIWDRYHRSLEQYAWRQVDRVGGSGFKGLILQLQTGRIVFRSGNWASIEDCARRINAYRRRLEEAGAIRS